MCNLHKMCFVAIFSLLANTVSAAEFDIKSAEKLFSQMANVINTRNINTIGEFLNYYIASDAVFYKKSMLITPGDLETKGSIEDVKYTRDQYIDYVKKIVGIGNEYRYTCEVQFFQLLPEGYLAYVMVKIEEKSTVYKQGAFVVSSNIVTTNCNYTLIEGSNGPKIAGGNCIEKIVVEK